MSDLATYQNWIGPGFTHLDESWSHEQTWDDVRGGFLAAIGVTEADLGAPDYRVLGILVARIDGMGEQHRRYALLAAEEREALVSTAFAQWQQEAAEGGEESGETESAEQEMQYVEGRGWMRYDAPSGEWVLVEGEPETGVPGEGGAPHGDGAGERQYVEGHGWMRYDPEAGEWVSAEAEGQEAQSQEVPHEGGVPQAPPMPEQPEVPQPQAEQPQAPPMPEQPQAHEQESPEAQSQQPPEGEAPPEAPPPAPLSDLSQEDQQDIVTAVEEAIAPAIEQVLAELNDDPDIDLTALSPEDIQEALAAALADPALNS